MVQRKVRVAVADYYQDYVRSMCLDEAACPELFGQGASSLIAELYGAATLGQLEGTLAVSLGCGNPVRAAGLVPGEVVLDLGCGPGLDCILASIAVGDSGRVIGIDLVDGMVRRATVSAARAGKHNVSFARSAMEQIPLPSATVDVVVSNCAVNLSSDKGAVYREVSRVLRPGGRLAVFDVLSDSPIPETLRSDLLRWAGCVSGALTARQYLRVLKQAGLADGQVREVSAADGLVERVSGAPRLYVGQVTARRPSASTNQDGSGDDRIGGRHHP